MEAAMQALTGSISDKLVKVEDNASWLNLEISGCVIVGAPTVRFASFFNVAFVNCVFLYDGMEVAGSEWLTFMSMERMPVRAAQRRTNLE
jgi:hypothetical protein